MFFNHLIDCVSTIDIIQLIKIKSTFMKIFNQINHQRVSISFCCIALRGILLLLQFIYYNTEYSRLFYTLSSSTA